MAPSTRGIFFTYGWLDHSLAYSGSSNPNLHTAGRTRQSRRTHNESAGRQRVDGTVTTDCRDGAHHHAIRLCNAAIRDPATSNLNHTQRASPIAITSRCRTITQVQWFTSWGPSATSASRKIAITYILTVRAPILSRPCCRRTRRCQFSYVSWPSGSDAGISSLKKPFKIMDRALFAESNVLQP